MSGFHGGKHVFIVVERFPPWWKPLHHGGNLYTAEKTFPPRRTLNLTLKSACPLWATVDFTFLFGGRGGGGVVEGLSGGGEYSRGGNTLGVGGLG